MGHIINIYPIIKKKDEYGDEDESKTRDEYGDKIEEDEDQIL